MGNGGADLQVNLAESAADGTITIKDMPVGHYSISGIIFFMLGKDGRKEYLWQKKRIVKL